jgi:hypothetical protein
MSIPLRVFGKTSVKISVPGLGGHHLGGAKDEKTAIEIAHSALNEGITFNAKTPMRSPEWPGHANFSEFRLQNSAPKDFGIRPMRASRSRSHNSELHMDPPLSSGSLP